MERKYKGAANYYSRYRPAYPAALVSVLRDAFGLDGKGRLLDLGCGPGSVAIPIAHLFQRVVAMDPEPDMLQEGRAVAGRAGIENIEWIHGTRRICRGLRGTFRLVTMGESIHWMDQRRTLDALYDLVDIGGGVAILGRGVPLPLPPMTSWRAAVCRVVRDYIGQVPLPWDHVPPPPEELHEAYLGRSRFVDQIEHSELFEVEWTVESIIGIFTRCRSALVRFSVSARRHSNAMCGAQSWRWCLPGFVVARRISFSRRWRPSEIGAARLWAKD